MNQFTIALIAGLGAMLGWGISDFFAKKTVDQVGNLRTLFWAQALGIIPLLILFFFNFSLPIITFELVLKLIVLAAFDGLGYIYFYKALEKGKVSIISPVVASYAAFSVLISALVFGETIGPMVFWGLLIVFAGILLTSIDLEGLRDGKLDRKDIGKGLPEALFAVLLFSLWFPFWDRFVSDGHWLFWLLCLRFVIAVIALVFVKSNGEKLKIEKKSLWGGLALIGLFDSAAYFALSWGYGTTSFTSIISVLSAAFSLPTLLLARVFLKEKLKLWQLVGVGAILVGLVWLATTGSH